MAFRVLLPSGRVKVCEGAWEGEGSPLGWRVLVGGTTGVVVGVSEEEPQERISSFPDSAPLLSPVQISLVEELSRDYLVPAGWLLFKLLPSAFLWREEELVVAAAGVKVGLDRKSSEVIDYVKKRRGVKLESLKKRFGSELVRVLLRKGLLRKERRWVSPPLEESYYRLTLPLKEVLSRLRSERKKRLVVFLSGRGWVSEEEVLSWGFSRRDLSDLLKKGLLERSGEYVGSKGSSIPGGRKIVREKGKERELLWDRLGGVAREILKRSLFQIDRGRSVLILLPELSELEVLLNTLRGELGSKVKEIHSGVNPRRLVENWFSSQREPSVVLGTYLASLCPVRDPGLVVLVGESSPGVKLRAVKGLDLRRLSFLLSKKTGSGLTLCTQAPTLGSYLLVKEGRLDLKGPPGDLPRVKLLKREPTDILTPDLHRELTKLKGKRVLLLVPKQGYSYVYCPRCESLAECPECGTFLTYSRKKGILYCTRCSYRSTETVCPQCEGDLEELGFGIEKALEVVQESLGLQENTVLSTSPPWGETFDVCAVLSADLFLSVPSYRSKEDLFIYLWKALMSAKETLFIQTLFPEEDLFKLIEEKDYKRFYERELEERRRENLPPFWRLLLIKSKRRDLAGYVHRSVSPHVRVSFNPREGLYELLVRFRDRRTLSKVRKLTGRFGSDIIEVRLDPF